MINKIETLKRESIASAAIFYNVSERTIRRWQKKLGIYQPKEGYGPGKITHKNAEEIRRLYYNDQGSQAELANKYGVSQQMIAKIINGLSHKRGLCFMASFIAKVDYGDKK